MTNAGKIESRYKLLCSTMMDAFAAVDMNGYYIEANQAYLDIVGYTKKELLELSRHELTPEKWHPVENRMIEEQVKLRGYSDVFQKELRRKDGKHIPVEMRIVLNRDQNDKPTGMWAILHDISERIEKEKDLQRFKHSVESSPDAVFWINEHGSFPYVNEQACHSLGYTRDEMKKLHIWDIDVDCQQTQWGPHWKNVGKAGGARLERRHQRKDGTIFPVEISSRRVTFNQKEHHVAYSRDISEQKKAYDDLQFFKHAIDTSPDSVFLMSRDGGFVYVNDQACRSLGYSRKELLKLHVWDIDPSFSHERWKTHWLDMRIHQTQLIETSHRRKDGSIIPIEVMAYHLPFGEEGRHLAFVRDITERRRAEKEHEKLQTQLLQSQKLESVGRLAGGVAHDFNNMLSVILGSTELLRYKIEPGSPLLEGLNQIQQAATRSKNITQQLLAFSRKQIFEPKILNVDTLIHSLEENLSRLIGEDIELRFIPCRNKLHIEFDPIKLEQILLNLVVNARDAMPDGGKLTIETCRTSLDEAYCRDHAGFLPGDFVNISLSDNGQGMPPEILDHIFDPFFTTKEIGKGTGLGLATVYGIVKQGGGFINVYSEPELGTTFKIFIPSADGEVDSLESFEDSPLETGSETILLVEDDDMVRSVTRMTLEQLGYTVISAEDAETALAVFKKVGPSIDLLVTDVVMPKMNGRELYERLKDLRPELNALFMSGYTTNVIVHHGVLDRDVHFIAKPLQVNELARKVRDSLNFSGNS